MPARSCFFEEGSFAYDFLGLESLATERKNAMKNECDWDDDTLISFTEDDTIFGPDGVYGWFMNLWYRYAAAD